MKIAITTVQIPFVSGGAEFLSQNLKNALIKAGHEAELVTMPFIDNPPHLLENHIIASRLMDITNSWGGHIDLCIGLKFPAYYIPHPNKVLWILHQHRQVYDLFDADYGYVKNDAAGREARDLVYNADNAFLPEAKRIYTIANNVTKRLKFYNGIDSVPLYHPCPDMDKFYCGDYEDYILMPSRINITKRQRLGIEALLETKSNIKLYLVGKADNPAEGNSLAELVKSYHLENRVRFFDFVSQEEKIKLYANAKAVLFIPLDEDYGYITLEGMAASKAVITAKDSGGPLEFVVDGSTGMVVEPTPKEIAGAMDEIANSQNASTALGHAAKQHLLDMDITWDHVVKELTRQ